MPAEQDQALAFILANGATAADFCGGMDPSHRADEPCQACLIAGGIDLPQGAGGLIARLPGRAPGISLPRPSLVVARVLDLAHAPQAPPAA